MGQLYNVLCTLAKETFPQNQVSAAKMAMMGSSHLCYHEEIKIYSFGEIGLSHLSLHTVHHPF